ncbi:MAG: YhbY family RNA-binding protein [Nanoarchaeota archaeon]
MREIKKIQIGKKGLTEEIIEQIRKIFENEQILKISLLKSSTRDKNEARNMAEGIVKKLGLNYTYKVIGFTISVRKWRKPQRIE